MTSVVVAAVAAVLVGMQPIRAVAPDATLVLAADASAPLDSMLDRLAEADVVFVGEEHDHALGHALELRVLAGLAARRPRLALSLEMFERDVQLVLDEYLAGMISESAFLAAARPWPNYKADYRPLVEFCRERRLPVIAANTPRRYVSAVGKGGQQALAALPRASRAFLPPLPYRMDLPSGYEAALDGIFAQSHGSPGGAGGPSAGYMKQAQALWDCGMADSIRRFQRAHRGTAVVHINGAMHSDHGWGAVDRLRRMAPRPRIAVVSIKRDPAYPAVDAAAYRGVADFVVLTPPDASPTHPAR